MFDGRWRTGVDRTTAPIGRALQAAGVTADVLTATGLLSAGATAVAVATGHFAIGVVLLTLTGMHDLFDGPVAKAAGTASVRGAFFDSVTDRLADALLLGGVAWYLTATHHGQISMLPFGILAVASLISYERAKAEALGIPAKGGLMERAERMILLGISFLWLPLLLPVLWVLFTLTALTAMGRFRKVWRVASGKDEETKMAARLAQARVFWREAAPEAGWRPWRDDAGADPAPFADRWRSRRQEVTARRTSRALGARRQRRYARSAHERRAPSTKP